MKKWARVLCLLFICAFVGVMCTACLPLQDNNSDFDNYDPDDPDSTPGFYPEKMDLYGTKVLYHPLDYQVDVGEGNTEDYFGVYSYNILYDLLATYGYVDITASSYIQDEYFETTSKKYYYDSVRYSFQSQEIIDEKQVYQEATGGEHSYSGKDYKLSTSNDDSGYTIITMDTANAWNWTFDSSAESDPQPFIYESENFGLGYSTQNTKIINSFSNSEEGETLTNDYFSNVGTNYYAQEEVVQKYISSYLNSGITAASAYGERVKALEYVIYCISMNATPKKITPGANYTLSIEGYSSVDAALEYAKAAFNRVGLYVGITEDGQKTLTDYILDNVIGQKAINADTVQITKYDTIKEYQDAEGNVVGTEYGNRTTSSERVNRNYRQVVEKIVDLVCNEVKIGSDDEDTVDNKYLASYIKDYFGNQFSLGADDGNEFNGIEAQEYQSLIIMPKNQIKIDNLSVFFMYDGNMDDITIKVHVNVFRNGKYYENVAEDQTTVPKGEFGIWDEHEIDFFGLDAVGDDGKPDREGWKIGEFNVDVGEGLLRPTKNGSKFLYNGTMSISDELRIVGTSKVKRLYKVVETGNGQYYGKLDHEQFAKLSGACDYMEIAYEIVKKPIDINDYSSPDELPDYRFYTAVTVMNS